MSISAQLRADLASNAQEEHVFQKHIVDGNSHLFRDVIGNVDDEYKLRLDIAQSVECSIHEVIIVGSAKLGFSVKSANFLPFDDAFKTSGATSKRSDVDVAIVNRYIYEKVAEQIFHLSNQFDSKWRQLNWRTNQFYHDKNLFQKYANYLAKGWLRPDLLPNVYLSTAPWIDALNAWQKRLNRDVNIAVYSNWTYLKHYHMRHLAFLRQQITNLEI